jgi:hypothetical protein
MPLALNAADTKSPLPVLADSGDHIQTVDPHLFSISSAPIEIRQDLRGEKTAHSLPLTIVSAADTVSPEKICETCGKPIGECKCLKNGVCKCGPNCKCKKCAAAARNRHHAKMKFRKGGFRGRSFYS